MSKVFDQIKRKFTLPDLDYRTTCLIRGLNNAAKHKWDDVIPRRVAWYVQDLRQSSEPSVDVKVEYDSKREDWGTPQPYAFVLQSGSQEVTLYKGLIPALYNPPEVTRDLLLCKAVRMADSLEREGFSASVEMQDPRKVYADACERLRHAPAWHP